MAHPQCSSFISRSVHLCFVYQRLNTIVYQSENFVPGLKTFSCIPCFPPLQARFLEKCLTKCLLIWNPFCVQHSLIWFVTPNSSNSHHISQPSGQFSPVDLLACNKLLGIRLSFSFVTSQNPGFLFLSLATFCLFCGLRDVDFLSQFASPFCVFFLGDVVHVQLLMTIYVQTTPTIVTYLRSV